MLGLSRLLRRSLRRLLAREEWLLCREHATVPHVIWCHTQLFPPPCLGVLHMSPLSYHTPSVVHPIAAPHTGLWFVLQATVIVTFIALPYCIPHTLYSSAPVIKNLIPRMVITEVWYPPWVTICRSMGVSVPVPANQDSPLPRANQTTLSRDNLRQEVERTPLYRPQLHRKKPLPR